MKILILNAKALLCLGLFASLILLSACAQQQPGATSTSGFVVSTPTAVSTTSSQTTGQGTSGQSTTTIIYENIGITFVSIEQKNAFSDDTPIQGGLLLRVVTREQSQTDKSVYIPYDEAMRLLLPDGSSVAPFKVKETGYIAQAITRDNWIDFPIQAEQDVNKLTLRIGKTDEHQMDVSLAGKSDLTKYQPRIVTPNKQLKYADLNWTITRVVASLSANGKQAKNGQRYITLYMSVDNPSSKNVYVDIIAYMRLKTESVTHSPEDTTLNSYINAGTTGNTCNVVISMPDGATALTLEFLAQPDQHIDQATTTLQVP